MDSVLNNFLNYNICKHCKLQLVFCEGCCIKEQVIKLYDKGIVDSNSTLTDIFDYCKKHKRKYDRLYNALNTYLKLEG